MPFDAEKLFNLIREAHGAAENEARRATNTETRANWRGRADGLRQACDLVWQVRYGRRMTLSEFFRMDMSD